MTYNTQRYQMVFVVDYVASALLKVNTSTDTQEVVRIFENASAGAQRVPILLLLKHLSIASPDRRLIPGICFSLEPGIYKSPFGARSEINILIDHNGNVISFGEEQEKLLLL